MSFNLATILTETTLAAPDAPVCRIGGTRPPTASWTTCRAVPRPGCARPA